MLSKADQILSTSACFQTIAQASAEAKAWGAGVSWSLIVPHPGRTIGALHFQFCQGEFERASQKGFEFSGQAPRAQSMGRDSLYSSRHIVLSYPSPAPNSDIGAKQK